MSQSSILNNALSSDFWEKKKKVKKEMVRGLLSQGQTHLAGCAVWVFVDFMCN
jgi:hypothetical protein